MDNETKLIYSIIWGFLHEAYDHFPPTFIAIPPGALDSLDFLCDLYYYTIQHTTIMRVNPMADWRTFAYFISQCPWVQLKNCLLNRAPKSERVKGKQWHPAYTGYIPMKILTRRFRQPVEVICFALINHIEQLVN